MVNFNEEKKLWKQGIEYVVGLDEAGRGPLAGPVVAAAVMINPKLKTLNPKQTQNSNIKNLDLFRVSDLGFWVSQVNDSKKLSARKREEIYEILTNHHSVRWGVGIVSEQVIDKINILEASKRAMLLASRALKPDFLLIDGNFRLDTNISQKSIIKGDAKVFSIAAASIIAKVTRDRIMQKMHKKYPQYEFAKHKGYGTAVHLAALEKFGACKIHRKTFWPVSGIAKS